MSPVQSSSPLVLAHDQLVTDHGRDQRRCFTPGVSLAGALAFRWANSGPGPTASDRYPHRGLSLGQGPDQGRRRARPTWPAYWVVRRATSVRRQRVAVPAPPRGAVMGNLAQNLLDTADEQGDRPALPMGD